MIVLKLEAKFDYDSSIPVILLQISTQLDKNKRHKSDYCDFRAGLQFWPLHSVLARGHFCQFCLSKHD